MKKFALLIVSVLIYSCSSSEEVDTKVGSLVPVAFSMELGNPNISKAGNSGPAITDAHILDSLVQDIRIFVFNESNLCEAYADFTSLHFIDNMKLRMTVKTGRKKFIFITNVCDNKIMQPNFIGKNIDDIHIQLEQNIFENPKYRKSARQLFYSVHEMDVQYDVLNKSQISMTRIVSQLETSVTMTRVWELDANNKKTDTLVYNDLSPYLFGFKAISVQYVPFQYGLNNVPDLLMNNEAISIVSNDWFNDKNLLKAKNLVLSFPTDQTNTNAEIVLAGLVNKNHPKFIPNPNDLALGTDTIVRYWFYEMGSSLKSNKRLSLTITDLIGLGSSTPISPTHHATINFKIEINDWDPTVDFMSADKNNIK